MKLKNVLLTLGLTLGVGVGVAAAQSLLCSKAAEIHAEEVEEKKYYLVGKFADNYSNYSDLEEWDNTPTVEGNDWYVVDGGASKIFNFVKYESATNYGDEFKFVTYNNWDDAFGHDKLSGSAANHFGNSGGNLYCNRTGAYSVSISGGTLYIDYAPETTLHLTGLNGVWGDGDAIAIDGAAIEKSLTSGQKFRIKHPNTWDNTIGWDHLRGSCYGSFANANDADNNIYINISGDYSISVCTDNHRLVIDILILEDSNTIYVLDLNGNLIASNPHCYLDNTTTGATTGWPGALMTATDGASHIFEYSYPAIFDLLLFNDGKTEGAGQTVNIDLTGLNGKCLVLGWDTNSEWHWTSNDWISLEAAKYIDNNLKFSVDGADEKAQGSGLCKTDGWYAAAKGAYESLSESVQKDVCSSSLALARLQAWAIANGDTFVVTDGVGSFSVSRTINMFSMDEVTNNGSLIAIVAITALAAAAGMFFIFRRKEQ